MESEPTEDPLHTMIVEEVTRPDGRYILYFGWPRKPGGEPDAPREEDTEADV